MRFDSALANDAQIANAAPAKTLSSRGLVIGVPYPGSFVLI